MLIKDPKRKLKIVGLTDEQLVEHYLASRHEDYFEHLYVRYVYKVYRRCKFFVKDPVKAQDLCHDIFLKLLVKLDGFKKNARFSTWLYSITYNHCMDELRHNSRYEHFDLEEHEEIADNIDLNHIFYSDHIKEINMRTSLESLSLEDKGILLMKYNDDLPLVEIADIFKTTAGGVKMRLLRAREKLRKKYLETSGANQGQGGYKR